jgi:hypothetical protein
MSQPRRPGGPVHHQGTVLQPRDRHPAVYEQEQPAVLPPVNHAESAGGLF